MLMMFLKTRLLVTAAVLLAITVGVRGGMARGRSFPTQTRPRQPFGSDKIYVKEPFTRKYMRPYYFSTGTTDEQTHQFAAQNGIHPELDYSRETYSSNIQEYPRNSIMDDLIDSTEQNIQSGTHAIDQLQKQVISFLDQQNNELDSTIKFERSDEVLRELLKKELEDMILFLKRLEPETV